MIGSPGTTAVSVDAVVLRGNNSGTQVLIYRRDTEPFRGSWALPGVLLRSGERITAAAARAASKAAVGPVAITGIGQLAVFDEPNRDPRGPTLSIAAWVTVDPLYSPTGPDTVQWTPWDRLPALAFDHNRILTDVRPVLAGKLWSDLDFTSALTGPSFGVRTALAITASLTDGQVDRGNLNRALRKVAFRIDNIPHAGELGRPGTQWRWPVPPTQ